MIKNQELINIVIPCYNEGENTEVVVSALQEVLKEYNFTIILVDDGSCDDTLSYLIELSQEFSNVKYLSLSRNFGHQIALKAGLDVSDGHCVISMDGDMQHPPSILPTLIEKWREGNDIVFTKREIDEKASFFKRFTSSLFYKIINNLSYIRIEEGSADFRLIDQKVAIAIKQFNEQDIFLRGLFQWVGYKTTYVKFTPGERFSGTTKYSTRKMLQLALAGITSFSVKPLRLAFYIGLVLSMVGFLYGFVALFTYFFTNKNITGWTSLIIFTTFIGGFQLLTLGILGEYIGKLFIQAKQRPLYLIKKHNIKDES